ncbi:MAG: GDP-fucose synthetase [Flavobacteriales bacterium TMED123]|nr:MAG: GDP-fucose synthetase [Flavobacteriales bacterium TMED123]
MNKLAKIYVAGHRGMVGSAIVRKLTSEGFKNLLLKTSTELDLRNQQEVVAFFAREKPDFVFLAAAKVGGILANNTYRADFLYDNLMIETNIIKAAHQFNVKKLLFLGSSCIYPKMAKQPITENAFLSGLLEPTNEPYAIAKIAGIKLCETFREQYDCNFIAAMPTNLYGPNDNYNLHNSHIIPALLRKFYEANLAENPEVEVWGDGSPLREFLHVDDCADACVFLMQNYNEKQFLNVGSGEEKSIKEVAETIKQKIGFNGNIVYNTDYPNGAPRKLMNVQKIHQLGWHHTISFNKGINSTITILEEELSKFK